ncbi:hypothetical protein B0H12DRAFT_46299 [Mycena haematopus]|nr:hypothetical protein B0H12DRAFT_46299 [Mycena haematopus]
MRSLVMLIRAMHVHRGIGIRISTCASSRDVSSTMSSPTDYAKRTPGNGSAAYTDSAGAATCGEGIEECTGEDTSTAAQTAPSAASVLLRLLDPPSIPSHDVFPVRGYLQYCFWNDSPAREIGGACALAGSARSTGYRGRRGCRMRRVKSGGWNAG